MKEISTLLRDLKMSTTEIAELTGKQAKHINRDAAAMLEKLGQSGFDVSGAVVERDARGYIKSIQLNRDLAFTLVTGYDVVLRHRVMTRWTAMEDELATYGYIAADAWYRLDELVDRFTYRTGLRNPLQDWKDTPDCKCRLHLQKVVALTQTRPYAHVVDPTQADDDADRTFTTFAPPRFYFIQQAGIVDVMLHLFGLEAVKFLGEMKHGMDEFLQGIRRHDRSEFRSQTIFRELYEEKPKRIGKQRRQVTMAEYEAICAECDANDDDYPDVDIID